MSLLSAVDLSRAFGADDIFYDISFNIQQKARIGLVGPNGVGKTTLIRILAGVETPSSGSVYTAKDLKIGYLPQNARYISERTLWEECLTPFEGLIRKREELSRLESSMAAGNLSEETLEIYGKLQQSFENLGGYTYENRIQQTLTGLGFSKTDIHRPLSQLSGGQRTRALLGRILLGEPDLLLLDEPTNHLDIAATEWLEAYFKDWEGAVLIVSHDRYFLDQVVNTIWEMTPVLEVYRGNYSLYNEQRAARYQRRLQEYEKQQSFIEKEEDYIRRNIAGQNTRQAQGRRRRLERLLKDAKLTPPNKFSSRKLKLQLNHSGRSGDLVIRSLDLGIGYMDDGKQLFSVPDLLLKRGECAAIIGPNGAGKTTFLKTLLEQIPPLSGEVIMGASLQIGYFAQAHEELHDEWTLMQEIDAVAPNMLPAEIRSYLARFLFTEDDVFKQVKVLSGGERGRLALACLSLKGANLLLLDEPTNHLDLPSQEVLQTILADFPGTILLVSHDRYLIDVLATQIWEVIPSKGTLSIYEGTYSEYRSANQETEEQPEDSGEKEKKQEKPAETQKKLSKWAIRQLKEKIENLETKIAELEERQEGISRQLENPPEDPGKVQKLAQDYQDVQEELEELIHEWSELSGSIEEL